MHKKLLVVIRASTLSLYGCQLSTHNPTNSTQLKITPQRSVRAQLKDKSKKHIYHNTVQTKKPTNCQKAKVTKVIDGDTVQINDSQLVRLIWIDTPETVDSKWSVEYYWKQASQYLQNLIEDKKVCLAKDPLNENKDQYDRLLRYIRKDDIEVNSKLLLFGFAEWLYRFPFKHSNSYQKIEKQAKNSHLWVHNFAKKEKFKSQIQNNKEKANKCNQQSHTICARQAKNHIWKTKKVRFFVSNPVPTDKYVYLNSNQNRDTATNLAIRLDKDLQNKFNQNIIYKFANKTIEVKWKIIEHNNQIQIQPKNKDQITIID